MLTVVRFYFSSLKFKLLDVICLSAVLKYFWLSLNHVTHFLTVLVLKDDSWSLLLIIDYSCHDMILLNLINNNI